MSAIWVAAAGVAVSAIGAGMSAKGAADSAEAIAAANAANAADEEALYGRQSEAVNKLAGKKTNKLKNLGNIFDRMESTGAFGDTKTLENLRQAQSDYSALAAGDFTGFENQLRQSLSDSLIATAGAGAPIGTFAGLAAQDQLQLRGQGIQTAMGISDYLSTESYKLLGNEFGIMDQKFEVGYKLDRDKTSNINNYRLGQASTEGVGLSAYGNATQQIGSTAIGMYNQYQNQQTIQQSNERQLEIAKLAYGNRYAPRAQDLQGSPYPYAGGSAYSGYGGAPNLSMQGQTLADVNGLPASSNNPPVDFPTVSTDINGGVLPSLNDNQQSSFIKSYYDYGYRPPSPYMPLGGSSSSILANVGAQTAMY